MHCPRLLVALFALALLTPSLARAETPFAVFPGVREALAAQGAAHVILNLNDALPPDAPLAARTSSVHASQQLVLDVLPKEGFTLKRRYQTVPAMAGVLRPAGLAALIAHPPTSLRSVQIDEPSHAHLAQSVPAIRADLVHSQLGVTGQNMRAAIIDTGVYAAHPDFQSNGQSIVIATHCFTQSDCNDGAGNFSAESDFADDDNGHGTNVSGIIASRGVYPDSHEGFAPGATLVMIKALDQNESGFTSDWISGMDWLITNQSNLNVSVLNMSLGTNTLYPGFCDNDQPAVTSAIAQLNTQGVMVFASAGNQGSSSQIASPACNGGVVAVAATYDSSFGPAPGGGSNTWQDAFGGSWPACSDDSSLSTVTCFSNTNSRIDVLAPGSEITSSGTVAFGYLSTYSGTSQASPTTAAVALLMHQANPNATPLDILNTLKSTGVPTTDTKNNLTFPRIDAYAAVTAITQLSGTTTTGTTGTTSNTTGTNSSGGTNTSGTAGTTGATNGANGANGNGGTSNGSTGTDGSATPAGCGCGVVSGLGLLGLLGLPMVRFRPRARGLRR
jgi:serine protease AprX